jgi:hypothetical protein
MAVTFLHYRLRADTLCLGERTRGGTFRPCASVFSYTTLAGALTEVLGSAGTIHAAARFLSPVVGSNREILTFAPRDRVSGVSTIPLQVEYLVDVVADLFILESDATRQLPKAFSFSMGAMRSKGFGRCLAERIGEDPAGNPRQGRLCVRLPDLPEIRQAFRMNVPGNSDLKMGYLFNASAGTYIRSFFEGSAVTAYAMILYPG